MIRKFTSFITVLTACSISAFPQFPSDPSKEFYKPKTKFSFDFASKKKGGAVRWNADRQEYVRDDYVILQGNVKIFYQDVTVSATHVTYNLRTKDLTAEGNVVLDQGPQRMTAERMIYNLDSETGTLFNAAGFFEPSIYFTGEKIEKIAEATYRLTEGVFTSCDLVDPAWSFRLRSGVITVDDYARLRDVSFRAKRVPLIWLPYIVWPTRRERAKGFLIPKIGFSKRFGTYIATSYFLPFGDSADATIYADYYSKGYHALGTEVRYVPTVNVNGKLRSYAVRDPEPVDFSGQPTREGAAYEWRYEYTHTQEKLPGGFRGVIDIRDFSDLEFFRKYERKFELATLSNIYSSAYLTKNRDRYSFNIRTDRRKYFLTTENQTFDQLPSIQYSVYPRGILNSPLYFSLESSVAHLRTTSTPTTPGAPPASALTSDYYRSDIFPTFSLQLRTPPWLSIKPEVSLRQTSYSASRDPLNRSQIVDESLTRSYAQAQVELVGPSLSRIFSRSIGGFTRFKHVIEPRARYVYTTDVNEQDRVIRFDVVDSPFLPIVRDSVEYSLTQRVIGKESGENANARDIMSLTFRQSVALSDPFERFGAPAEGSHRFSPLQMIARVNPYQSASIDAAATFSNITHEISQANLSANLSKADSYLNLTWFSAFRQAGSTGGDSSQYRLSAGGPIWHQRLRADTQINYDAGAGQLQEQRYLLGFNASCYNVAFEYRDAKFPTRNRDYQISVSLKNVGTFVDLRGSVDALIDR